MAGTARYPWIAPAGPANETAVARTSGSSAATDNAWPVPPPVGGVVSAPAARVGRDVGADAPEPPPLEHAARNAVAAVAPPQIFASHPNASRRLIRPSSASSTTSVAAYSCIQLSAMPRASRVVLARAGRRRSVSGA